MRPRRPRPHPMRPSAQDGRDRCALGATGGSLAALLLVTASAAAAEPAPPAAVSPGPATRTLLLDPAAAGSPERLAELREALAAEGIETRTLDDVVARLEALAAVAPDPGTSAAVEAAKARADEAYLELQLDDAAREIEGALALLERDETAPAEPRAVADLLFRLALIRLADGDDPSVDEFLRAVLRLDPHHAVDPAIHGPPVHRAVEHARAALAAAELVEIRIERAPSIATVRLDGVPVDGDRVRVATGLHLVTAESPGHRTRSNLFTVDRPGRWVPLVLPPAPPETVARQALPGFRVWLADGPPPGPATRAAGLRAAALDGTLQAALDPDGFADLAIRDPDDVPVASAAGSRGADAKPWAVVAATLAGRPPAVERPRRSLWKSPWFWAGAGAVVVGGAAAATLLADDPAPRRELVIHGP